MFDSIEDAQAIQRRAERVAEFFVTQTRDNGEEFVTLAYNRPLWMVNLMHHAHGDMLPDDHRYQIIHDVLWEIAEADPERLIYEDLRGDLEPPHETHKLLMWAASNGVRWGGYVDDNLPLVEEWWGKDLTLHKILDYGYRSEMWEVFDLLLEGLEWAEDGEWSKFVST